MPLLSSEFDLSNTLGPLRKHENNQMRGLRFWQRNL